jgi:hypothetical protein
MYLWPFGVCSLWFFGIGSLPVWYVCTNKNLATLVSPEFLFLDRKKEILSLATFSLPVNLAMGLLLGSF